MIPLYDDNPARLAPVVTIGIIAACVLVFLWQLSLGDQGEAAMFSLGFIPDLLFSNASTSPGPIPVSKYLTIFTSMFMHGDVLHIAGNMLYLWIFGNNIEGAMGHVKFVIFYLLCGVAAALTQAYMSPDSQIPMIGASGAIAGILGAYLILYPRAHVYTVIALGVYFQQVRLPAIVVLGGFLLLQFVNAALTDPGEPGVAWWAHIGGFVAGIALLPLFKARDVPFFAGQTDGVPRRRGPWG